MIMRISILIVLAIYDVTESVNSECSNDGGNSNSTRIFVCKNFRIQEFGPNELSKLTFTSTEAQIASEGHWEGVKPDSYRLSLNFTTATHYEGALAIDVTIATATNKLFLHKGSKLSVDYAAIFIQQKECKTAQADESRTNCIESIGIMASQDLIFIQMNSNLLAESKYTIGIPKFRNDVPFSASSAEVPISGVFWSDQATAGQFIQGVPAALSTVFRLREARSVFPCFDHPRLKARYTLCIEHPDSLLAASNTPIRASIGDNKGLRRKRTCFETTPPLASYLFTFSLMSEYENEQRLVDTELVVEIFAPRGQAVLYRWLYDAVIEPMRFMGGSTRFRYPLKRIAFLIIDQYPYAGVENFGLITLNSRLVKGPLPTIAGRVLVNHELVHQWFGGVVTASDWREICVQEGLTTYYEWAMTAQTLKPIIDASANLSVGDRAKKASEAFNDDYTPFIKDFQTNRDIIESCYGVPPLFFKSLADAFGDPPFYRLFAEILAAFQFDNADIDAWDEALAKATGRQDLHNYIRAWFTLPGYPRLFISRTNNGQIELGQAFGSGVRPIFIRILESSSASGNPDPVVVIDKQSAVLQMNDQSASWILVNPDDEGSPVRKVYTLEHYRNFVACNSSKCKIHAHAVTPERRKLAGKEFCSALLEDRFPWGLDDQTIFDTNGWIDFFKAYADREELEQDCQCCLLSKEQLHASGKLCAKIWNSKCKNLRINRQLGRGYKVEE